MAGLADNIRLEELKPELGLGVRVTGLDLASNAVEQNADALRDAFARYACIVVEAPDLDPDDQVRVARVFGRADADFVGKPNDPGKLGQDGRPKRGIMFISNKKKEEGGVMGELPDGELHFHSDGAHRASPYRGTTLYSMEIPSTGGETKIADLRAAYDDLSGDMKQRLEGLKAHNIYDTRATLREQTDETDDRLSNAVHSLVRTHPDTGRKLLNVNYNWTTQIADLPAAESRAILAFLYEHIKSPEFQVRLRWQPGDIAFWDNRAVQHYAVPDWSGRRVMQRIAIAGEAAPIPA